MSFDLVVAGVGGQPVDRVVELLAAVAEAAGQPFTSTAPRGVLDLGGPRLAQVSIGECWSSIVTEDTGELLLALESGEALRAVRYCARGGAALVDRVRTPPAGLRSPESYPEADAVESAVRELVPRTVGADFGDIARAGGAPPESRHAALLGAASALASMKMLAPGWGPGLEAAGATDAEQKAFAAGAAWVKEQGVA